MTRQRELYEQLANANAREVIRLYSTSFGVASSLLAPDVRQDVANIYGLVRLADEVVDGVAAEYGLDVPSIRQALDALEAETNRALDTGYSTNLIVHAFAATARRNGFGTELVTPFFSSMRMDLERSEHTPESFREYVYGSAEVVGLMCLCAFTVGQQLAPADEERFVTGARALGSAFQKVNFLRDIAADVDGLGRQYFPGVDFAALSDETVRELVADIDRELALAREMIRLLPASSRRAVALAEALFAALNRQIAATSSAELAKRRLSVPTRSKAWLYLRARMGMLT